MREVSAKQIALSERLHRQRIDTTERLVASIAHDIRSSVASVVYSADFLNVSGSSIRADRALGNGARSLGGECAVCSSRSTLCSTTRTWVRASRSRCCSGTP